MSNDSYVVVLVTVKANYVWMEVEFYATIPFLCDFQAIMTLLCVFNIHQ